MIVTATTTTAIAAPAASTQRQVKQITARNRSATAAQTVTFLKTVAGSDYHATPAIVLGPGEMAEYVDGQGWSVIDAQGRVRVVDVDAGGINGRTIAIYKIGTAPKAAGSWYCFGKDAGAPGAWAPGTPGLSGRATDGTSAADAGCVAFPNAATGTNYLAEFSATASNSCMAALFDLLWVNSGLVVTTLTAQAISSVAFPARDANGSSNGAGLMVGLLVTTATTNGGAIANITLSYTDQDGNAGATATMASFPATATVGTVVWFELAAGDSGIRSIQSITIGTSLVSGAVSLIVARAIDQSPCVQAFIPAPARPTVPPGVRLYAGTCLLPFLLASGATATILNAQAKVIER